MARERRRPARSSRRRNRREEKARKQLYQRGAFSAAALMMAVGIGYLSMKQMTTVQPGEDGCLPQVDAHTIMWIDPNSKAWNASQKRTIKDRVADTYKGLEPNERLTLLTTEPGHFNAGGGGRSTLCAPDYGDVNPAYREAETKKTYDKHVSNVVDEVLESLTFGGRQSPVLESQQGISYRSDFSDTLRARRLVLISDMIHVTNIAQFCQTKGHLPSFRNFKKRPLYNNIKPASLQDVKVKIHLLVYSGGYGGQGLEYCTEKELRDFWTAYFEEAGAANVDIIPIPWTVGL